MFAGGCPGDGRWRKVSRGVGDAAPYGLPGNGRQREPPPHPALRGHLPPRGKARAVIPPGVLAEGFAGRRGRRPLRFAREWAAAGACPSSGPAGPPSPKGEGKGCCWRQREAAAGWGHPALRMGIWKRPRGLRGHPFPGRRTVGAGHARPGGWREHPSMVRSVGRGLDPSAGDCPGDGCWRKVSRGVGDAAPYGLPGNGRQREPPPHPALRGHLPPRGKARAVVGGGARFRGASGTPPPAVCPGMGGSGRSRRGGGTRPTDGDMETPAGFTRTPIPGPPHGRGRACPARGLA